LAVDAAAHSKTQNHSRLLFLILHRRYRAIASNWRLGKSFSMSTVAFICFANICRSPMAHAIFEAEARKRGLAVEVLSAGVSEGFAGTMAAREARLVCEKHETPMSKLLADYVGEIDLASARRVFVMESSHLEALLGQLEVPAERFSLLGEFDPLQRGAEIEDPIGQDMAAFDSCYGRLRDCITHYLETTHDFDGA
jgi:protein-tyrosine phosphatase